MTDPSDQNARANTLFRNDATGERDSASASAEGGSNAGQSESTSAADHSTASERADAAGDSAEDSVAAVSQGPFSEPVARERQVASEPIDPSPEAEDVDPLVGQTLAERYRVERLLGTGGMGAVYRAEHVHMRKAVALKVLHREMTAVPEIVARFEREAVAAARIEHPNVAAATDFGRLEDGAFYLVLEYVEGKSLSRTLRDEGVFTPLRAVHVARQIAEALAVAHAVGVVHRDLKPDNVMLVGREHDPDFVKVLDFGIAKLNSDESSEDQPVLTQAGAVFGTPEYMSPEQAKGEPVDTRSDLYTLGMILYEMLSGTTAFVAEELIVILTRHLTEPPPPLPSRVPEPLRALVENLLEKDPEKRIQSAAELADTLGELEASWTSTSMADDPTAGALSGPVSTLRSLVDRVPTELVISLRRPIAVGRRQVPLWWLASAGTLLVMLLTLVIGSTGDDAVAKVESEGIGDKAARLATAVLDPELSKLLEGAEDGDREALAELRKRVEKEGGAREWLALGRGYAKIRHLSASVEAYGKAVKADQDLASDSRLLADVRAAAEDRDSAEQALDTAVEALGAAGADLVFSIWSENKGQAGMTKAVAHAQKLLKDEKLRKHASPALLVALELQEARACSDFRNLLPQVKEHGDERSLRKLQALRTTKGCGFLGLGDCFECLRRKDVDLSATIAAVEKRPSPELPASPSASGQADGS